jgi:hypothetical protein
VIGLSENYSWDQSISREEASALLGDQLEIHYASIYLEPSDALVSQVRVSTFSLFPRDT